MKNFFSSNEEEKSGSIPLRDIKQFTCEEIITFYVEPRKFLDKKFDELWEKTTKIEIGKATSQF